MFEQLPADPFEHLRDLLDDGALRDPKAQLHDRSVAALVGEMDDFAEGHGVHCGAVMRRAHFADRHVLDRAFYAADKWMNSEPKGVIQ